MKVTETFSCLYKASCKLSRVLENSRNILESSNSVSGSITVCMSLDLFLKIILMLNNKMSLLPW